MTPTQQDFWKTLFSAPAGQAQGYRVHMRLLRKGGRPFLLLPMHRRMAAATIDLYPAQTGRARIARQVLRWLLRASFAPGAEAISFAVALDDPFAGFLRSVAGDAAPTLPPLGILAGNPMSEGQRLLLLVFDTRARPVAVVKAGFRASAIRLIEKEASFLAAVPAGKRAIPRLRARFAAPGLSALALDFYAGDSPRPEDREVLAALLDSWINVQESILLAHTPDWIGLTAAASGFSSFASVLNPLHNRCVRTTMSHGDLAPWNIKVSPAGAWTVLDWERGELKGVPGWDWFHYVVQPALLVQRLPSAALIQRLEALLQSNAFRQYAARAGINGCERELVLGYLLHMAEVIKPSEGREATTELLRALMSHWRKSEAV